MRIKLVVGLGNPGRQYANTRHNMGFKVLDTIAERLEVNKWKERNGGLYFDTHIDMARVIFLKPQRFINLSGEVMIEFVRFFDIKPEDILVVSDDLDLPLGSLKLKEKGSSGGHNGLKNIEEHLKTNEYKRIKIGISNDKTIDTKDYVLGKLTKQEIKLLKPVIESSADAVLASVNTPFNELMSKYNTRIKN
ncbi:MAG: aminoacyl-tRNA hydrolase [Bacilli bacterium]|nr:aminoacyl-tRNA hydrolase [Bacilli bacterium]